MTQGNDDGSIDAIPRSVQSSFGLGKTKLAWRSNPERQLEVHVGAPGGPLLAASVGSAEALTGLWVSDGMSFFLQDLSDPAVLPVGRTLDRIAVQIIPYHDTIAEFVGILAARFDATHVIDVASLCPNSARQLALDVQLIGIGPEQSGRDSGDGVYASWITADLDAPGLIPLPATAGSDAVILCRDHIGWLRDPGPLLDNLASWLRDAPVAVVTVPVDAPALAGAADPVEASIVLEQWLGARDLQVAFAGVSLADEHEPASVVAVIERSSSAVTLPPPSTFRVTAILMAYNEEDIIVPAIARLLDQDIAVHLIENWSTDATYALAERFSAHALFTMERFPEHGPSQVYDWQSLLKRAESVSRLIRTDWFLFQDVDEIRSSPWPDLGLREGLYRVDQAGFNCVDHTLLEFRPTDKVFPPGGDLEAHLRLFEFGQRPDHFVQIKAWKNLGHAVALADSGGHEVQFPGRRIFPYKFLSRHYAIRSQAHGEKKVLDRKRRWNPEERARGWHVQYDNVRRGHNFLREPGILRRFDRDRFYRQYLVPRLSGVGVPLLAPSPAMREPHDRDCD